MNVLHTEWNKSLDCEGYDEEMIKNVIFGIKICTYFYVSDNTM